jgi:hypothetical protein
MPYPSNVSGEEKPKVYDLAEEKERRLRKSIAKLMSLEGGEGGLIDVLAFGPAARGPLRTLLFEREPSGIYQPRCRAARALGLLGAYDILREFLVLRREVADPVERTGEDAVINAAARALAGAQDPADFRLLSGVLKWRILSGVIETAGAFERPEAIPLFIDALAEDDCRPAAEAALRRLGRAAEPALIECAVSAPPEFGSETRRRQRRSALRLLVEMGISPGAWEHVRHLMNDPDFRIATLACKLGLICDQAANKRHSVERLICLLDEADWMIADEIESFLSENLGGFSGSIELLKQNSSMKERAKLALVRAEARAAAENGGDGND